MRLAIALLLGLFAANARASDVEGTISNLIQRESDGLVYVHISGSITGTRPQCAGGTSYFMVRDENSNTGKRLFATLLAAKLSGTPVLIQGNGTCLRWGDGEDIFTVQLRN